MIVSVWVAHQQIKIVLPNKVEDKSNVANIFWTGIYKLKINNRKVQNWFFISPNWSHWIASKSQTNFNLDTILIVNSKPQGRLTTEPLQMQQRRIVWQRGFMRLNSVSGSPVSTGLVGYRLTTNQTVLLRVPSEWHHLLGRWSSGTIDFHNLPT